MLKKKKTKKKDDLTERLFPFSGFAEGLGGYTSFTGATSIYKMRYKSGQLVNKTSDWMPLLIPNVENIKFVIFGNHQIVSQNDRQKIVKNLPITVNDTDTREGVEEDREAIDNSERARAMKALVSDMPIIDSELYVIVKAKDYATISQGIEIFKQNAKDQGLEEILVDNVVGREVDTIEKIFTTVPRNIYGITQTAEVTAGTVLSVASGLQEKGGFYFGSTVTRSAINPVSIIKTPFTKSGIIAGSSSYRPYTFDALSRNLNDDVTHGSSFIAMYLSYQLWLNNKPTRHVVLNKVKTLVPDAIKLDISDYPINPLEVYGTENTVVNDTNANVDKIIAQFNLISGKKDDEDYNMEVRKSLLDWLNNRAGRNGIYTDDPLNQPERAKRILARKDTTNFPKLSDFVISLQTNISDFTAGESERATKRRVYDTLNTAVQQNQTLFSVPTKLPRLSKDDLTVVYDLSSLVDNPNIQTAMFINQLSYLAQQVQPNETVFLHGLQLVKKMAMPIIATYINKMKRRHVTVIVVYDEVVVEDETNLSEKDILKLAGDISEQSFMFVGQGSRSHFENIQNYIGTMLPEVAGMPTLLNKDVSRTMYYNVESGVLDFFSAELML